MSSLIYSGLQSWSPINPAYASERKKWQCTFLEPPYMANQDWVDDRVIAMRFNWEVSFSKARLYKEIWKVMHRKATLISSRGCLVDWEEAEGWWGWDLHWSHTRWKHIKNPGAKSRIRIKTWFGITVILLHWNRVDITEGEEAGGCLICFNQCNNSMRHMCLELKKGGGG